jgi:hypothetical protein
MLLGNVDTAPNVSAIDSLRRELARVRAESDGLRIETTLKLLELEARAKELLAQIEHAAVHGVPHTPPLALVPPSPIVDDVAKKRASRERRKDHPAPRLIGNVAMWCRDHKPPIKRAAFRSWYVEGEPYSRPVPAKIRRELHKTHGVPLDCWGNGVTDADYTPRPYRPRDKKKTPPAK